MKKILLLICLQACAIPVLAQQFLLYNTETVYDSFENPSQRVFIRDTTRRFAFNFFFPSFTVNGALSGNVQARLLDRALNSTYNNSDLEIGSGNSGRLKLDVNAYLFMFKIYLGGKNDKELGFSMKLVGEGRARVTDEALALFNGGRDFTQDSYSDLFNVGGFAQVYQQYGISYREKVTPRLALGAKVNFLMGVEQHDIKVTRSDLEIDRVNNTATLSLGGAYYKTGRKILGIKNPGLSVSLGGSYLYENGLILQGNIKDFGFIYWGANPERKLISGSTVINNFTSSQSEKNVSDEVSGIINRGTIDNKAFFSKTNGIVEASLSKKVWLDDAHMFRAFPTLILQKEAFYDGITAALMSHFQYNKLNLTLSSTYDNRTQFSVGTQFMYKTPNTEFYIGTERLVQTSRVASWVSKGSFPSDKPYNASYTGLDIFMGMAFKFGYPIESPANSSVMPMGDDGPGFLGRIYNKIFGSKAKKRGLD